MVNPEVVKDAKKKELEEKTKYKREVFGEKPK
jgi:hypothetical protein